MVIPGSYLTLVRHSPPSIIDPFWLLVNQLSVQKAATRKYTGTRPAESYRSPIIGGSSDLNSDVQRLIEHQEPYIMFGLHE